MAADFVGRKRELGVLQALLDEVERERAGRMVVIRGRRQVGKSRLVEEFLRRARRPAAFFQATRGRDPGWTLEEAARLVAGSTLSAAAVAAGATFRSWDGLLAAVAATADEPEILVVDEFPYLLERDAAVEGAFQTGWDRHLRSAPVLLIVVGSDLAIMEALSTYGRPLYGRPSRELVVPPLSVGEVGELLGLSPAEAFDAAALIGGFPLLARSWRRGESRRSFLARTLDDPTAPLLVTGERMVAAEFPPESQPRSVLRAIGAGERTFTDIGRRSGISRASLDRALTLLTAKRVVERRVPVSAKPSKESRYVVEDPYLRFWLRFLDGGVEDVLRGRGRQLAARIEEAWPSYLGQAVEPLLRHAVEQLLPDTRLGASRFVGGYWTRGGDVEVDLVGGSDPQPPTAVHAVGSIKWRARQRFQREDLVALTTAGRRVPGADRAALLGVSRAGFAVNDLDVALTPADLLAGA